VDGAPVRKLEIGQENTSVLLFQAQGEQPETHTIRIVKLTENLKTELGIASFSMDGEIQAPESGAKQKRIEFIGDSITCGFGNLTDERDRWFYTADEDASFAHGPMAAEKLGMDYSVISISGICATQNAGIPIQDKLAGTGLQSAEKPEPAIKYETYDFEKNHNDYVVLNLGTNDACGISLSAEPTAVYENFKKGYRSLIETIRKANGKDTYIICALGTMNYYLWSDGWVWRMRASEPYYADQNGG
jgi:lysophospholipase L1-like esterase